MITKDDLPKLITRKKIAKDALPPAFVMTEEELLDKRLTRAVREEETFNPDDLTKGGVVTLPDGMDMVSLPVERRRARPPGSSCPGSRVDVLATVRLEQQAAGVPAPGEHARPGGRPARRPTPEERERRVPEHEQRVVRRDPGAGPACWPWPSTAAATLSCCCATRASRAITDYNIKKVKKLLEDEKQPAESKVTDGSDGSRGRGVAALRRPRPRRPPPKAEMVKVLDGEGAHRRRTPRSPRT